MSADFGYINARVRGLKSRLLGPDFYAQSLGDASFQAFVGTLAQTGYGRDLEETQAQAGGLPAVDAALASSFRRTSRSLLAFSSGWPHELIALLLRRYDLANIKAVARAKHSGRPAEEAQAALLPAGELKPALLEALVQAPDIAAMGQVLGVAGHPLASAVRRAARDYAESGDLFDFELALDRAYHASVMETADELPLPPKFRAFLELEVAATNLRTALKLRGSDSSGNDLFVKGGKGAGQQRVIFDAIVASTGREGLAVLAGTRFAAVADTGSLGEADAAIRAVLDAEVRRHAAGDPLGPFVVLDYLRRLEGEMARLRLLARGKYYDVPRQRLEQELGHASA